MFTNFHNVPIAPDDIDLFSIDLPLSRSHPVSYTARKNKTYGNTVGFGFNIAKKARYECLERYLLKSYSTNREKKYLRDFSDKDVAKSFEEAIMSIHDSSSSFDRSQLYSQKFQTINSIELFTGRCVDIPLACVRMDNGPDRRFFPSVDTGGACIHSTWADCLHGCLMEFVERQSLIVAWLAKKPHYCCTLDDAMGALKLSFSCDPTELCALGEVRLHSISIIESTYVILSTFSANNVLDSVRFACGLGSSLSLEDAISKSVSELWQGYFLMQSLDATEAKKSKLRVHARAYHLGNKVDTPNEFGQFLELKIENWVNKKCLSKADPIQELTVWPKHLCFASELRVIDGQNLYIGKVLSPDMFLNADIGGACNHKNKLAQAFVIPDENIRPIPFA